MNVKSKKTDSNAKKKKIKKPEWAQDNAHSKEFASFVMEGIDIDPKEKMQQAQKNVSMKSSQDFKYYVDGILNKNRTILAQAISIIESNANKHFELSQKIIKELLPYRGNSIRIGITGVPGVGKSTFIESFGTQLCSTNRKVAVLAVDPSSGISGGSILGDKTRMEKLSNNENAFIRPSPSGGTLGGVNRKSRETIILCEAFGFDTILVETVGVGQSETTVKSMVDFFLFLGLPGAGDELQGIKKGIIEMCDAIAINKADGDNITKAQVACAEFKNALHYSNSPYSSIWQIPVMPISALNGNGIEDIWQTVLNFTKTLKDNNLFHNVRNKQDENWILSMVQEEIQNRFFNNDKSRDVIKQHMQSFQNKSVTATDVAQNILKAITSF